MHAHRYTLPRDDLVPLVTGASLTLFLTAFVARSESVFSLAVPLVVLFFVTWVVAWLTMPHVAVAASIPLFCLIPAGKVFVTPYLGPVKDLVVVAAGTAVAIRLVPARGRRAVAVDGTLMLLVGTLAGLYLVNPGGLSAAGHHGSAWAQGARLMLEPLILLVAGATLTRPARTLTWAGPSMILTGCFIALVGIAQQWLGEYRLIDLGYSYESQVRTAGGHLRSFGTLDDPFAYAAVLLLALATVIFWMKPGPLATAAGVVISAGLAFSLVRSAAVIGVALISLWLVRSRQVTMGLAMLAVSALAALALLLSDPGASETRTSRVSSTGQYLTLNGRTTAWKAAFRGPANLPFGLGVGEVGTAAERAKAGVIVGTKEVENAKAVDSGYFAAIADIGLVGLAVLLLLIAQLAVIGIRGTRRPGRASWLLLAFLLVVVLDATTRSSFTGFPSAYLGMLLIGVGVGVLAEAERSSSRRRVAA